MTNRLEQAVSPYLRAHATNPVEWFPWGQEPFKLAQDLDRPVMVSIGYSSCHWCHVMARESFSDQATATFLNDHFVSIKVDREEHPDADTSFMAAASAYTKNLGWPLTVFATPEGKTFFAGTYFPPEPSHGMPSFRQVLAAVLEAWQERREQIETQSEQLRRALTMPTPDSEDSWPPNDTEQHRYFQTLVELEDDIEGGFGLGSKFPNAPALQYLAEFSWRASDSELGQQSQELLIRTLRVMAESDLRDRVEGGFFRYTVHRNFTEPHYERMLYDNAQLLDVYSRMAIVHVPDAALFQEASEGIAEYLLTILQQPDGGFAAAEDSESMIDGERVEGGFYQLTATERAKHPRPARDDKILTGWNGLAIAALCRAAIRLGRTEWSDAAQRAADYLLESHLLQEDGHPTLIRTSERGKRSSAHATLEDYGLLAEGLLELGLVTGNVRYLTVADTLIRACLNDEGRGFQLPGTGDPVLAEQGTALAAEQPDAALPSPLSAIAAAALLLYQLTGDTRLYDALVQVWRQQWPSRQNHALAAASSRLLELRMSGTSRQLVIITPDTFLIQEKTDEYRPKRSKIASDFTSVTDLPELRKAWVQNDIAVLVSDQTAKEFADAGFELFEEKRSRGEESTVYNCENFVCRLPVALSTYVRDTD